MQENFVHSFRLRRNTCAFIDHKKLKKKRQQLTKEMEVKLKKTSIRSSMTGPMFTKRNSLQQQNKKRGTTKRPKKKNTRSENRKNVQTEKTKSCHFFVEFFFILFDLLFCPLFVWLSHRKRDRTSCNRALTDEGQ